MDGASTDDQAKTCGIRRGQIYTADEIVVRCGISTATLQRWIEDGLKYAQKFTKRRFFLGDDVIAYLFDMPINTKGSK